MCLSCCLGVVLLSFLFYGHCAKDLPNIIFMMIDDLGWNDVSYNGGCDYETPNIDSLQTSGLTLNSYYVQPTCTPTRASLLTGVYTINSGLQHSEIQPTEPFGLPLRYTTLPQELQKAGYDTHMLGKWHVGDFNWEYTPTYRGFDSFFGFHLGKQDYFNHSDTDKWSGFTGYDLRNNTDTTWPWINDTYSTYTYGNLTLDLLEQYARNKHHHTKKNKDTNPFFMYVSWQAVHAPNQAPIDVIDSLYGVSISDYSRSVKAAMTTVLDDVIGDIVYAIKHEYNLWNDLLLIISTDNGAAITNEGGSNWPLRGGKESLWEGGIRGAAFITGGYLKHKRRGKVSNELMHAVDWLPTLCDLVGHTPTGHDTRILDGISMADVIQKGSKGERTELVHNIDPVDCSLEVCGAIRLHHWKLVVGPQVNSDSGCWSGWCYFGQQHDGTDYTDTTVQCGDDNVPPIQNYSECPYNNEPCLYNIATDPCEYYDVAAQYPHIANKLYNRLLKYNDSMVTPLYSLNAHTDDDANPTNFDGWWTPWKSSPHQIDAYDTMMQYDERDTSSYFSFFSHLAVCLM